MVTRNKNTAPTPPRWTPGSAMVPRRNLAGWPIALRLAAAAADGRAVEAHVAAAAFLAAAGQSIAAGLEDTAAGFIAAEAGDAAAVLGVLALGDPAGEVALANHHPVDRAAARAHATGEHLTKILQGGAGDVVVAAAMDLEATFALLELEVAPRHDTPVLSGGDAGGAHGGGRNIAREQTTVHHDSTGHHQNSFRSVDASGLSSRQLRWFRRDGLPFLGWAGETPASARVRFDRESINITAIKRQPEL